MAICGIHGGPGVTEHPMDDERVNYSAEEQLLLRTLLTHLAHLSLEQREEFLMTIGYNGSFEFIENLIPLRGYCYKGKG